MTRDIKGGVPGQGEVWKIDKWDVFGAKGAKIAYILCRMLQKVFWEFIYCKSLKNMKKIELLMDQNVVLCLNYLINHQNAFI